MNYLPNSHLKGYNNLTDFDIEESKRLDTHSRENESMKFKENTKRRHDFLSSSSDRMESPNSFMSGSLRQSKSYMMSNLSKPSVECFRPIRNIPNVVHSPEYHFKPNRNNSLLRNNQYEFIVSSPAVPNQEAEIPLIVSNSNIKISPDITIKFPMQPEDCRNFFRKYFKRKKIGKRFISNLARNQSESVKQMYSKSKKKSNLDTKHYSFLRNPYGDSLRSKIHSKKIKSRQHSNSPSGVSASNNK